VVVSVTPGVVVVLKVADVVAVPDEETPGATRLVGTVALVNVVGAGGARIFLSDGIPGG
jgi:hypothetical protein